MLQPHIFIALDEYKIGLIFSFCWAPAFNLNFAFFFPNFTSAFRQVACRHNDLQAIEEVTVWQMYEEQSGETGMIFRRSTIELNLHVKSQTL